MTVYRIAPDELGGPESRSGTCPVSFIVPAFQAARTLRATITSIRTSAPPSAEVIVVDDGSLDATVEYARQLADTVIVRPCQGGAARSRNDGARVARGDVLFFVDADVTVNPTAVTGALGRLEQGADAVFGAYEALPPDEVRNVATNYKNILHHYTHLQGAGEAHTFWSGFGAVRRDAFFAVRGFDPAVTTTADVEDIHQGYRLRSAGYRIVLDPALQVQHHKRYTVRGVITSDVFHRAIPWTRAVLQLRTFSADLNLRTHAMLGAALSFALPLTLATAWWLGAPAFVAASAVVTLWLAVHARFLWYVSRHWSARGALASAGLLYLYYLYSVVGTGLGVVAYVLRHDRRSVLNRLRLETTGGSRARLAVTVAVVGDPGERFAALSAFPPIEPWWELLVIAPERPRDVPTGAKFHLAPPGSTRADMRQLGLDHAQGEMFAVLDADCVPEPGWLDAACRATRSTALMVAGSFHDDRRSIRRRAEQLVRYWQWRPEQPDAWIVDHPSNNAVFRTEVVRQLGGFKVEGVLPFLLAGFGARPVRFDRRMGVMLRTERTTYSFVHGVAGVARRRAVASVRYFDLSVPHRLVLVAYVPLHQAIALAHIVRSALRDGLADRSFWLALPLTTVGLATSGFGRIVGLLFPDHFGAELPRTVDDLVVPSPETAVGASR